VKEINEILAHVGVKGMKWGVRKSKIPKMGPSDDAKKAHRAFVKSKRSGVVALSNKELKALNARLELESKYSQLSAQPSRLDRGQAIVKKMLGVGQTYNDINDFRKTEGGKKLETLLTSKTAKKAAGKGN
jgi:hypothetical protein